MKKVYLTILTILIVALNVSGQKSQYFSMYFQNKSDLKTEQLRKYQINDTVVKTEDYISDKLELSGEVTGSKDIEEINDFLFYIRSLGDENKYKIAFKKLSGEFEFYYKGGGHSNKVIFKENHIFYTQVWSKDGEERLNLGTGINKYSSDDNDEDIYEEYKDSILVKYYTIRPITKDTIYLRVDKQAAPKEGFKVFYQELVSVLKYPVVARFVGKEGLVYIQFIVDENGKLKDFSPKTKEGYCFETKAVRKLEKIPNWNPAVNEGRNVKMRFTLPVQYKLIE